MSQLWEESEALDHWGFLLVDAKSAFNELNRNNLLWTIQHKFEFSSFGITLRERKGGQ